MKINISKIESSILSCLKKFPIEAILGLCFFVMYCIVDAYQSETDYKEVRVIWDILRLFPAFFVLCYTCNITFHGKWRFIYYLSLIFFVPTFFIDLNHFSFSIYYFFTMLLTFFLLLIGGGKRDNTSFAQDSIQIIINLIISLFIGHVLELAICAIMASIMYIFNLDWFDWPIYTYLACLFIFIPLLFCSLQQREKFKSMPPFMDIIITFILSPAVIIYTGILYLYFITIIANWELPKGGIGYMVLAFVIITLGGRMAQLAIRKRYYDWFYNYFSFIAIPPLIIFWIGTIERITTYSFTASRVYLLVAGVLMTLYIVLLLSKRLGNYQLMLIISSFAIAILTYIPGISAKSIGIHAQEKRLEQYIQKLDMLDSKTHKLKQEYPAIAPESNEWKEFRELEECYSYLSKEVGSDAIEKRYGQFFYSALDVKHEYVFMSGTVDIADFNQYHSMNAFTFELNDNGVITISKADKSELIRYNIDSLMNAKPELLNDEDSRKELLTFRNDSCMLILQNYSYEKGKKGFHCPIASATAILTK